ncbi:hypothetical protein IE53DRAFT_65340 [Violaceomyces palustris]|uniref:Uncharacterized protein n=1 Tax=Violaceomyces palustris TaxID=1673888 RepID=A0ACD0NZ38_9BASI|nr:hypothetical protein IE53DRAFT_65340 [Violaceomyces palustris]
MQENIPLGWDTESKVAQFVQALIREEVDKRNPVGQIDAFVLDVSIPSPYPNPWEEGYESSEARHSHPFFKVPPGKRKRERRPIPGHCFVTLTPSAKGKDAARILCQQWPWSLHSLGQRGLGFDSMPQASKQAKAAGLRCLSLSGWESLRVEYERWRGLLRQSHRASKVGTERYDPSPKGEACGDGGKARDLNTSSKAREGDPIIQDVVAKRKIVDSGTAIGVEPRLTGPNSRHDEQQQLDYPRHTILRISCPGTMAEEGQVKGKGRGSSSEKVKGSIKARLEKLRPESVDYVDLVDGGDKCFIRTPNQEVATALKEAIAKAESAKARGDKAGSQAGQGKGVVSFGWVAEILSGEEEGNYWSRLPQRVRNSAKKKSMVSSSRVSETPTTSRADRVDDGTTETVEDGVGSKEVGSGDRADKGRSGKKRKKRKRERMEGDGLEVEGEEAMDG